MRIYSKTYVIIIIRFLPFSYKYAILTVAYLFVYLMSLDQPSISPTIPLYEANQIRSIWENSENIEQLKNQRTQKLLWEAIMFLSKSRLFWNNPDTADQIKQHLLRAKETHNTRLLEHIIERLQDEKRFILEYARQFASESADNLPLYEFQNNLTNAYIQDVIHKPESKDRSDMEVSLKQAQIAYNLA